jgi:predicted enzyme related to lactoylglutathione lyase
MPNPVVHWELMSKNPAKVSAFYEKVFGWSIRHMPEMDYHLVETGGEGRIDGGISKLAREESGNMTFYINVDDLSAFRKKIAAAGGKIRRGQEAPGMGSYPLHGP